MPLLTLARAFYHQHALSRIARWQTCSALATVCFAAVCLATFLAARSDADHRAEAVASSAAAFLSHDIARTIEQFDRVLQTTIARLRMPVVAAQDEPMRSLLLLGHASDLRHLGFINVLDENGRVTAPPQPSERASNWANRDYFAAQRLNAAPGLYISRPFGTAQEEYASVALSRRVSHDDGSFAGVVSASLHLSYFRDLFKQVDAGPHASITLLRNDETLLMRLPFNGNDIGRIATPGGRDDQEQRSFAVRQIGEWPLFIHVGVASQDIAGAWPTWTIATLVTGTVLAALSVALIIVLQREVRRRETAERDNQHKSDYLAMASHELRTPLHSILGNADRLRAEVDLDPSQGQRVAAIVSAGQHLRGVVDQILNCLQIEARNPTPRMSRIRLPDLLEQCCLVAKWDAAAKGLTLRHDMQPGAPENFVADYNLLRQVLANLLANAIKFTAKGEIVIAVRGTVERVTIEIRDTGCGIPLEQRHKLFGHGERLGAERTAIPGNGIGLATSRRLVHCMGGDIGYRENLGGGSIFWVSLPTGMVEEDAVESAPPDDATPATLRVLLVDDVAMNREVARCYLEKRGHAVTEAPSGADAVRLAGAEDFNVVLMDVRMPGMDGLEATRRIRMIDGPRGRVPIVAVTANALDHHVVEGRRAGMVAHLVKPFTADELLEVVERVTMRPAPAAFDPDVLAQLAGFMSSGEMERHLLDLALKLEDLLMRLEAADSGADLDQLRDLAHEVAGTAGTFGFAALSVVARDLDVGIADAPASVPRLADALTGAARAALAELRELTAPESVGAA